MFIGLYKPKCHPLGSGWHIEYGEIRDLAFYNKLFALVELG